jgi:flavin reductase (DIM6/NTAB) family NADH-FMN oxidoreductase RutF
MTTDIVTLFRRLTLGVCIVGVTHSSEQDAFTGSAVMQASYNPF